MSDLEYKSLFSLWRGDKINVLPYPSDVCEAQKIWNQYATHAMKMTSVKDKDSEGTPTIGYSVDPSR